MKRAGCGCDMKVFLSYPHEHEGSARQIKEFVRSVGVDCWFDKDSLIAGQDWERERGIAQSGADLIVLLCASQTTDRNGVYQRELNQALKELSDKRLGSIYIIPVRVEEMLLPPELSKLQFVNFYEIGWRQKLAASFLRAFGDRKETAPAALEVAAAPPDEGGLIQKSIKEELAEGEIDANWIEYTLPGQYWEYVNSEITHRALGGVYSTRREFVNWWKETGSSWEIEISEFYRKGQLVSLIIRHYHYFSGAAHPNHGITTLNILGENAGVVSARDVFDTEKEEALKFITDYVNFDLRRQYSEAPDDFDISYYAETYGWEFYDHYTFNEAGMRLNLSAASGLPHALGYHEVYLPWEHVRQYLAPVPKKILLGESVEQKI